MKAGLTDIITILDKSGSMESTKHDVIGGFNRFLDDQKKLPGQANMTMVLFDSRGNNKILHYGDDIQKVQPLDTKTYVPGGSTALLEAMARTLDDAEIRINAFPDAEKPEKVIVVVITDGEENDSDQNLYPLSKVFEKVQTLQNQGWTFVYLGANQDAIKVGSSMGFTHGASATYQATTKGQATAYDSLSSYVLTSRSHSGPMNQTFADVFNLTDTAEQNKDDKTK